MKKLLASFLFILLLFSSVSKVNDIVMEKGINRYYMIDEDIKTRGEVFDVDIFGSCHAYTSFNPIQFDEEFGYTAYNMSNPGEIIPISYVRMENQFKEHKPKVALVEIWGVNFYNTYIDTEKILNDYSRLNLSSMPISPEKLEVISEFEEFDFINQNFALASFKNRVLDLTVRELDFNYSNEKMLEGIKDTGNVYDTYLYNEMKSRLEHNGCLLNQTIAIPDYKERQAYVDDEELEIEPSILKWVDRIIELCQDSGVELIFYRAPYISKEDELKKANFLERYLAERGISYYDLEQEIDFNSETDFIDDHHLSATGCNKATAFLGAILADAIASQA